MSFWLGEAPLILASKSAARQALLRDLGLPFMAMSAGIDERAVEAVAIAQKRSPEDVALHLARAKALAVSAQHADRYVVGADQILVCDGVFFHQPGDRVTAAQHLRRLSGKTHHLHAAFSLTRQGRIIAEDCPYDAALVGRFYFGLFGGGE
jgi:septum formation protein